MATQLLADVDVLVVTAGERARDEDRVGEADEEQAGAAGRSVDGVATPATGTSSAAGRTGSSPTTATPSAASPSAAEAAMPPTTTTSAAGTRGAMNRSGSRTASATRGHASVGEVRVADLAHDLDELRDRVERVDVDAEQLAELPDDQHDRDAVDVADQHGAREVVGDQPRRSTPGEQEDAPTSSASVAAVSARRGCRPTAEAEHGRADQRRERAVRARRQLARGSEQRVGDGRQQQRVQAGGRGRARRAPRRPSPRGSRAPRRSAPASRSARSPVAS